MASLLAMIERTVSSPMRSELSMKCSWPFMKASISSLSSGRPTPLMTSSRCFHVGETELRPAHHWDINLSTYSSDWLCGCGNGVTPDRLASWETWLARTDTIWTPITASSLVRSSDKNLLSGENRDTADREKQETRNTWHTSRYSTEQSSHKI